MNSNNIYEQKKKRRKGWKFWMSFWLLSFIFLFGWFAYWKVKNQGYLSMVGYVKPVVKVLPINETQKKELNTILEIAPRIAQGEEKTFLLLFQNNHELRPGGGYIGTFGIIKIKDEKVTSIDTHDTNVFDSGVESGIEPPRQMVKLLGISDWELRDSNWSADFPTNAKKAEEFYHLEGGEEQIDGVVAISTKLLSSFLEITGPVSIEDFPGEYNSENAISKLQYQVEKGYVDQDIEEGKRKYIMKDLSNAIVEKAQKLELSKKKILAERVEQHLNQKDVMIFFKDDNLQNKIDGLSWTGRIKESQSDYLMMIDANLSSLKTDQVIKREFDYTVDFSYEKPRVDLKITYDHTGRLRDWLITDYTSFLRVYVPRGSWLINSDGTQDVVFGEEREKKYFGSIVKIPLGRQETIKFSYYLPENITIEDYKILIQKQSGVEKVQGKIKIIDKNGKGSGYSVELKKDWEIEHKL